MNTEQINFLFQSKSFVACNMRKSQAFKLESGSACLFSARSPSSKKVNNEDAAAIIPINAHSCVLAVADGLGGESLGDEAARIVVDTLRVEVERASDNGQKLRTGILNALEIANYTILGLGVGAATTVVIAEISNGFLRSYHVGDSSLMLVDAKGKTKLRTLPHSPVGYIAGAGMIDEREAIQHEGLHLVSNVLGLPDMSIEIGSPTLLSPRDRILLASDGVFDNFLRSEIVEIIRQGSIEKQLDKLVMNAHKRMTKDSRKHPSKPDDCTAILFSVV